MSVINSDARVALSRVHLRESFVMHETADLFVSHLTEFANTPPERADALAEAARTSLELAYGYASPTPEDRKPFIYQDGIAIIPIHGALLNRFGGAWSFATGYNYIRAMMNAALADDDVELIVYDVDSPGGEAAGCFELADEMRASREIKPSLAVVDALSASAGYALASAASQMVATPSSKIGSIGVVRMHIDMSGALSKMGITVTFVEAPEGGQKTAGSPFAPLSDEARADWQSHANKFYDDFAALIVANRGIGDAEVRDTKARVFRADEALALGLIDAVRTPSEAVSSFLAELADDEPTDEEDEEEMSKVTGSEATSAAAAPVAAAAAPAAPAAPTADAIQAAITADRERMSAIKALPEAANRPKLADHLALSGLTVDAAKATLGVAAEETKAAEPAAPAAGAAAAGAAATGDTTNHFANAMERSEHPNVGAGDGERGPAGAGVERTDADISASIIADQAALTGRVEAPKAK